MTVRTRGSMLTLALVSVLVSASLASAQSSGRQTTPDGRYVLVNREEGGLQWAILYSPDDGTLTGNVFDPGGSDPSYIWCERAGDDGSLDPAAIEIQWRCEGSEACKISPCDASNWTDLGQVNLGGFFFLPAADPFVTLQEPGTVCDPARVGFVNEFPGSPSFEVDTSICRYATMTQPSRVAVGPDDTLFVRVWNFEIAEPPRGSGSFVLMLGDEVLYGERFDIPKPSGLLGPFGVGDGVGICLRPGKAFPEGTQVAYNLQLRNPPEVMPAAFETTPDGLERPLHSSPGVVHMLEITVGSNCEGEPEGQPLIANGAWRRVSIGVPGAP